MNDETITFTGQEATQISFEQIDETIRKVNVSTSRLNHVLANCTLEQLERFFGAMVEGDAKSVLFGCPLYQKNYVPKGEIWFMDKEVKVINRFKL
jgi:hypothetical protein